MTFRKQIIFTLISLGFIIAANGDDWTTNTDCPNIDMDLWTGPCKADWAIIAASVSADILCLKAKSSSYAETRAYFKALMFSYQDLLCNCRKCHIVAGNGCFGGEIEEAFNFFAKTGVTGGGNKDYAITLPPYPSHLKKKKMKSCLNYWDTPCTMNPTGTNKYTAKCADPIPEYDPIAHCPTTCNFPGLAATNVTDSKGKGEFVTGIDGYYSISTQITTHPVATKMQIYEDIFLNDGKEVYIHTHGRSLGSYYVKVVGVDTDSTSGRKYYLIKTTFGKEVGDNGKIKVLNLDGHCDIYNSNSYYPKVTLE